MTDELVLLSLQRALLGVVTPELRGVTVGRDGELVRVRFLVDGPVGAGLTEGSDEAEAMLLADLGPPVRTAFELERYDVPGPLAERELSRWVYLRYERPVPGGAAGEVLLRWLTVNSVQPWRRADLDGWQAAELDGWTLFDPPGQANRLFLVGGETVYAFAPSDESVEQAMVNAGSTIEGAR